MFHIFCVLTFVVTAFAFALPPQQMFLTFSTKISGPLRKNHQNLQKFIQHLTKKNNSIFRILFYN